MEYKEKIIEILKTVYDPEIPINIYDLGLIYDIKIKQKEIKIIMTLTSPNCPSAQEIPEEIYKKIKDEFIEYNVDIELTWDPPWDKSKMSEDALIALDLFDMDIPYHPFYYHDDFHTYEIDNYDDFIEEDFRDFSDESTDKK